MLTDVTKVTARKRPPNRLSAIRRLTGGPNYWGESSKEDGSASATRTRQLTSAALSGRPLPVGFRCAIRRKVALRDRVSAPPFLPALPWPHDH